jgi:hypothetical protein
VQMNKGMDVLGFSYAFGAHCPRSRAICKARESCSTFRKTAFPPYR